MADSQPRKVTVFLNGQSVLIGLANSSPKGGCERSELRDAPGINISFSDLEKIEDAVTAGQSEVKIHDRTYKIIFEQT